MTIHYARATEHVALVTLDRPDRRNALDLEHMREMGQVWRRFRDDPDARVAVVTGAGRTFCAGADLAAFFPPGKDNGRDALAAAGATIDGRPDPALTEWLFKGLDVYKPVVAAVNGPCLAGGMELLCATDIRIAAAHAVFGLPEVRRGLVAGGGSTVRLPRQVPWAVAMELLLIGDSISAEKALAIGLVNEVVADDQLLDRAVDWAARIAANPPAAVHATKESALRNLAAPSLATAYDLEAEIALQVMSRPEPVQGARAFLDRG